MTTHLKNILQDLYIIDSSNPYVASLFSFIFAYILFLVTNKIVLRYLSKIFEKTSTKFDDILMEQKVFQKLPYLIPLIFLYSLRDFVPFLKLLIAL